MRSKNIIHAAAGILIFAGTAASPAAAQLANASATTLGLAGNQTATARGIAALSVNPAGLGMPGSGFTLALVPAQIRSGIDPITLHDLKLVQGAVLSRETKEDWLARATEAGGQTGTVGADVSLLALTFGRFGFQASELVAGDVDVSPDVLQVLLYGNAGRTGNPANISLQGSAVDGFAVSTFGGSIGIPMKSATGSMAVGATLKYSVGNAVLVGRDQGGVITGDPVRVDVKFPVIMPPEENQKFNNGSGVGLDVGVQAQRGKTSFGAAVLNVFNTFKWKTDGLVYRPVTVLFDGNDSNSNADEQPVTNAPSLLKTAIEDMKFDPILSVGVGYDVTPDFTVSADFRNRFGDGRMEIGPKLHLGAGAEFRGLKVLQVRAGAAVVTDGIELGGGASLVLGPVNLSFAGGVRSGDLPDTTLGQFTLSFGGR